VFAAFYGVTLIFMIAVVICNISVGIVYDTDHFGDTLFLLGASWRAFNGLTPVIDFGHFYGGVTAEGVAAVMHLIGPDVFAIEYFVLFALAALILVSIPVLSGRISNVGMLAVAVVIATLLLSRYPLETNAPIIRIVSTHSFLYNRIGTALLLIVGLFVVLRGHNNRADLPGGMLAGLLLVVLGLTKPTFVVVIPFVLLALALQRRWHALGAVAFGFLASSAIIDPFFQKWLGSLSYIQAHVGDTNNATTEALIRKAVQIPLYQPVVTGISVIALCIIARERRNWPAVLAILLLTVGGVGMVATMGGNGSIGQIGIPLGIFIAMAASETALRTMPDQTRLLGILSFVLVMAFSLPHALNLAGATLEGVSRSDQILIRQGPYSRYLSIPEADRSGTTPPQYEMLAAGIDALHALGDPSHWGIIADSGGTFEQAVLGRPVPGYPLWQRPSAPELAPDLPIPADADIIMIGRSDGTDEVGQILQSKLSSEFELCARSAHWDIHARRTSGADCVRD